MKDTDIRNRIIDRLASQRKTEVHGRRECLAAGPTFENVSSTAIACTRTFGAVDDSESSGDEYTEDPDDIAADKRRKKRVIPKGFAT